MDDVSAALAAKQAELAPMFEYVERIQQPGHGWGDGCEVVKRQTKTIGDVKFLALTVVDLRTGERERLYLTGDGFEVSPCIGSYGSGVRWSVGKWDHTASPALRGIRHVTNLSAAARVIRSARGLPR
jgi:hypothetical protein